MSSAIATTNASMAKSIPFSKANLYAQYIFISIDSIKRKMIISSDAFPITKINGHATIQTNI